MSIEETCFFIITQYHIHQESHRKKYWILTGLFYLIHHICQTLRQVISSFYVPYKMHWMTKTFFQNIRLKCLWKISRAQNQLNFSWSESTSYLIRGKKWFKTVPNILLIVKVFMKKLYFLKQKLSMTQPNIYTWNNFSLLTQVQTLIYMYTNFSL